MPMTTRTRRARALQAAAHIDSDVDMETEDRDRRDLEEREDDEEGSNVDVEAAAEREDDEEEEGEAESEDGGDDREGDEDDEQDDEIQSEVEAPPPKASSSRLKIRLKMPSQPASRYDSPVVESEDSTSNDSQPSTTRPMTTRQAVLASMLDSSHVSLEGSRQKKAPLNETELALRREETARKRRNLTEKKLEDEKAETINRLLKKQSRPRNKRTTAQRGDMDDVAPPGSLAGTRSNSNSTYNPTRKKKEPKKSAEDDDQEEEADEEAMEGVEDVEEELTEKPTEVPTMYRWISTSRIVVPETKGEHDQDQKMLITFSVPTSAFPPASSVSDVAEQDNLTRTRPTNCAAPKCNNPSRYRWVKDWTRGACGIPCLKVLDSYTPAQLGLTSGATKV